LLEKKEWQQQAFVPIKTYHQQINDDKWPMGSEQQLTAHVRQQLSRHHRIHCTSDKSHCKCNSRKN